MAIQGKDVGIIFLGLTLLSCVANAAEDLAFTRRRMNEITVIDATHFGLKSAAACRANAAALTAAWKEACGCSTPTRLVIPPGDYELAAVSFMGPCKSPHITFEILGTLKASRDKSDYNTRDKAWIKFDDVNQLAIIGNDKGVFNGQGEHFWKDSKCVSKQNCKLELPASLKFCQVNNAFLKGFTSLNSPAFHMHVVECNNFTAEHLNVVAPAESPNTDGMHISGSTNVNVLHSHFGTGDDCLSVGHGNKHITIGHIDCGPGHGISVGSLGKYKDEKPVSNILIHDCTFTKTDNGARIKTWLNSPDVTATNITFKNLIMNDVKNPILIDQEYGLKSGPPSRVQLSGIHFENIRGTTPSEEVVNLICSQKCHCQSVELKDIDMTFTGKGQVKSVCTNTKAAFLGIQKPLPPICK